jgi:hypothetical protein
MLAVAAAATPAMADPKPTLSAAQVNGAAPGGFADWDELYGFQARLNAAAEQILAAGGAGNASIVAAPENRELRVYWNGALPEKVRELAGGLDVPVAFLPARFTHKELVQQAQRLATVPGVNEVAPNADGSGLAVTVAGRLRQTDRAGLQAGTTIPLTMTDGQQPRAMAGRQADTQNYWGGSRYNTRVGGCTNGIPVVIGGVYFMMSAAHCGNPGDAANIPGQPTPTGTIKGPSPCRDTTLIDYQGAVQPRSYSGAFDSTSSVEILGAASDFVGNRVATSGASSGEHKNVPVLAVDVFATFTGIACQSVGPMTKAGYSTATCAVAPGDSGGPVYVYVGPNVKALGTITAANGAVICPGMFPSGGNTVYYAPLMRPAGDPQFGSLTYYGATAPPVTTFDLNGTWTDGPGRGPGPVISVRETTVTVNMSAFGRPTAHGAVLDSSTITVTFPDDAAYTGRIERPNVIRWSNNSVWTKI